MKKTIYLIALLSIFFSSCVKEVITDVYKDKVYSWSRLAPYTGPEGIVMSSFTFDFKIYFSSINSWSSFDSAGIYEKRANTQHFTNNSINYKLAITNKIFAYNDGVSLTINKTADPETENPLRFVLSEIDPDATVIDPITRKQNSLAISKSSYCLAPSHTKDLKPAVYIIKPHIDIYNNDITIDNNPKHAIVRKTIIQNETTDSITSVDSYYDYFFITCGSNAYRIDTLGNASPIIQDKISQFIQKTDSLIAFSTNYDTYVSIDKGKSWTKSAKIPQDQFKLSSKSKHVFCMVNKEMIAYPATGVGALYRLKLENGSYSVNSIKIDGLENCDITSITFFWGNVYITTLSGIYRKFWPKFLVYN